MKHTRFPKEDHLLDWARQDNKVTKGDRVDSVTLTSTLYQNDCDYFTNSVITVEIIYMIQEADWFISSFVTQRPLWCKWTLLTLVAKATYIPWNANPIPSWGSQHLDAIPSKPSSRRSGINTVLTTEVKSYSSRGNKSKEKDVAGGGVNLIH